eukprot:scaffold21158_cov62-Phaeocystis_antarctica.AAC.6
MSLEMRFGHMKVIQSRSPTKVSSKGVVECPSCAGRSPLAAGLRYRTGCPQKGRTSSRPARLRSERLPDGWVQIFPTASGA